MTSPDRAGGKWPLEPEGVWLDVRAPRSDRPRPGLFLDRDGILVDDVGYLHRPTDIRIVAAAAALVSRMNRAGVPVAVATNQSGIARGYYGWAAFAAVDREISARLSAEGAEIDAVAAAPFHPDFTPGYGAEQAHWRKPGPGMLLRIAERLNIDLARSWMVGNDRTDVLAARGARLAGAVYLIDGHEADARRDALELADRTFEVMIVHHLGDLGDELLARLAPREKSLR